MKTTRLRALLCGAALLMGCGAQQGGARPVVSEFEVNTVAFIGCAKLGPADAQKSADVIAGLGIAKSALVGDDFDGLAAALARLAGIGPVDAAIVERGLGIAMRRIPEGLIPALRTEYLTAALDGCVDGLRLAAEPTALIRALDAVDAALQWLAAPAAALSATEIDIRGDLAVLCNGQGNGLSLVRLDGNQTGTEIKTIAAKGKPRTCVVAGDHVVTSEVITGNPATLDLAVYSVPGLAETDRIAGAGLSVVLRPASGESLIYAHGARRRCRYGLENGELTEQVCRALASGAGGTAHALTPTRFVAFQSTLAELWTLPGLMAKSDVLTGAQASRSSTEGESIVANGRDLLFIEGDVLRSRVASAFATLGILKMGDTVYQARGATGSLPPRVEVWAIDPTTRQLSLSRTIPTSLANDLARGPDGVYQSDASLGILRVERLGGVLPTATAAPTEPAPTQTNTEVVVLPTSTRTNTPASDSALRSCIEGCLAE